MGSLGIGCTFLFLLLLVALGLVRLGLPCLGRHVRSKLTSSALQPYRQQ